MKINTQNCRSIALPAHHVLFVAGALCLSLSGCSSSNDGVDTPVAFIADDAVPGVLVGGLNGMEASEITSPWLAVIDLFRLDSKTPGTGDAYVSLVPYDQDKLMSDHVEFYTKDLDTCAIKDLSAPSGNNNNNSRVSGGDSLSINTPEGTWYTLEKFVDDDIYYETDNGLPGALPVGATLSIPGDVFPGPVAYPLYEPDVPVRLLPAMDEQLTIDTQYSWIPGGTSTMMQLSFLAYDSNGDFLGFPIGCDVLDDGSFDLPADVRAYIATSEDELVLRYSRSLRRLDFRDGVVVFQNIEVAE